MLERAPRGYTSYSPSSVTLFFMPVSVRGKLIGSKGVGISLYPGMWSRVLKSGFKVVSVDGESQGIIQQEICKMLKKECGIESYTPLPISQGFGISAAAAITSALSLNRHYGMSFTTIEVAKIAQKAELKFKSGLGDVTTQITGGVVYRISAGPKFGDRIPCDVKEFLCCVVGEKIPTSSLDLKEFIKHGKKAMEKFSRAKSLENAFKVGREFARDTNIDKDVRGIIEECTKYGNATQIMLGNSVIAYGKKEKLLDLLESYGKVYRMKIDFGGSRYA